VAITGWLLDVFLLVDADGTTNWHDRTPANATIERMTGQFACDKVQKLLVSNQHKASERKGAAVSSSLILGLIAVYAIFFALINAIVTGKPK
jgi:hypothetical protein